MGKLGIGFLVIVFCSLVYITYVFWSVPALQNYQTRPAVSHMLTIFDDTTPLFSSLDTPKSQNQSNNKSIPSTPTVHIVSCFKGSVGPIVTATAGEARLGNQMFIYATMYATLLKEKGQRSGFVSPEMYPHFVNKFHVSLPPINSDTFNEVEWTKYDVDKNYPTQLSFSNEAPCLTLCCYPQQWELFDSFKSSILQEFKFQDHIVNKSKQVLSDARQKFLNASSKFNVTLIGVHVRRTDYIRHSDFIKLYLPEIPFYRGAMKYMAEKYENPVFVLASDDIGYCKQEFRVLESEYKIYYCEGNGHTDGNIGLDLATLANCDHLIFGVGTFGFWAGYLGRGEVVYCSCAKSDSYLKNDTKHFLPSWTGIEVNGEIKTTEIRNSKTNLNPRRIMEN